MKTINKGIQIRIYPNKTMEKQLIQNIGNTRFVWNNLLSDYKKYYPLFKEKGYKINPNMQTFNILLNWLKTEHNFLKNSESTSLQQTYCDLIKSFQKFFKEKNIKYPRFKSKKNPKQSFRIQNVNNNIHIINNKLKIPKHGLVKYRTSTEYKKLLNTSKINNCTIKIDNGKWYAVINIETTINELPLTNKTVGIDLGMKNLATLSNGEKITNLNLTHEDQMIKKYQKSMSRKKYSSKNYYKTLEKYRKWVDKRKHKLEDHYHKLSLKLVKEFDLIGMETLNILGMKSNGKLAPKLQKISIYKFLEMIQYKCEWYGKSFHQVDRFFPSSKLCSKCGFKKEDLTLAIRKWKCPDCGAFHDRDVNAAINILKKLSEEPMGSGG